MMDTANIIQACMHPWSVHPYPRPHSDGSFLSPADRPQSQANEPRPVIHVPETHASVTLEDASAHLVHRTVPPATLTSNSFSAQFASGPLHTHHVNLEVQYVMSPHPPPSQNQLSQQYMYHGYYPADSNRYPTPQYYPAPHPPRPPYHQPNAADNDLSSHHQTHGLALPMLQPVASLFRPGLYNMQQYPLPLHNSTGYFGLPAQYRPNEYQSCYNSGPAPSMLRQGTPTHGQKPFPQESYSRPRNPRLPPGRDPNAPRVQPSCLDRSPSSKLGYSNTATSSSTNPHVATAPPPEQISAAQSAPNSETWEQRNVSAGGSTFRSMAHNRPLVRRRDYHPNPPPNRTEWVMWMGNVPNDSTHDQLWQFLRRPDTVAPDLESSGNHVGGSESSGVLSVFLITRSNCAFVNYQSKQHLNSAISRFNGRQLRPHDRQCPRLVCRARRRDDELRAGVGAQRGTGLHTRYVKNMVQKDKETTVGKTTSSPKRRQSDSYTAANSPSVSSTAKEDNVTKSQQAKESPSSYASTNSSLLVHYFPRRFFILKSLTQDDLNLSVEHGVWATQKHNERILDQAFRTSQEVTLIFSVNKSGEFYGYARMASNVYSGNHSVSWAPRCASPSSGNAPSLGILGQGAGALQQSPQMITTPIKRLLATGLPSPDEAHSPHGSANPQAKAARDRRSAPAVLRNVGEDIFSPDPLLRPITSQVTQHPNSPSSTRYEPGKRSVLWSRTRGRGGGVDDPTLRMPLQPVIEEVHSPSGAEEDTLPAPSLAPPQTDGASEVEQQQREEEVGWGQSFKVDWSCTKRVPFHRTRHLRNPWNHGREIKVSRDGTEVEPTVGQQLIDEWSTLASEASSGETRRGRQRTAKSPGRRGGPEGRPKHVTDRRSN